MTLERIERARGHRYELDGRRVEGVTTLLSGGLPKPALSYWAARSSARYAVDNWKVLAPLVASGQSEEVFEEIRKAPFQERDRAAVRGTRVHGFAEALSRDQDVDVPEDLFGYVSACRDFLDDWHIVPILTEAPIASRADWYAGTFDLVAQVPGGEVALFDYKTSRSGIWPESVLQLAAYRHAEFFLDANGNECPMDTLGITATYAVHLRANGYSVQRLDTGTDTYQIFRSVAAVARAAKNLKSLIGPPADRP